MSVQLDFFKSNEECELDSLRIQVLEIKKSSDKVRKSLFARNGELLKRISDQEERLAILERNICNPDKIVSISQ